MAPLKFEDNIRDQFKNREIKPSAEAWDKLAARLDEAPKREKKGFGIWWAIAAGIAGLALIGSLIWSGDPAQQQNEIVIEEPAPEAPKTENVIPAIPLENDLEQQEEVTEVAAQDQQQEVAPEKEIQVEEVVEQKKTSIAQTPVEQAPKESEVIFVDPREIEDTAVAVNTADVKTQDQDAVAAKVEEVVGKIKDLEAANAEVSEEEIADLLLQAQRELKTKSMINMETLKVDANALLMDVEYDLERSFRDKVFDALGDGYNKIRTAMATRNN
ncbi:hypothetical protein [Gilvibacter sp.]|uniref:hypothetical protein n=1 Tax=Gilvibacter sp. TaxID=2729997 RepID=UPI003F4A46C5